MEMSKSFPAISVLFSRGRSCLSDSFNPPFKLYRGRHGLEGDLSLSFNRFYSLGSPRAIKFAFQIQPSLKRYVNPSPRLRVLVFSLR